MSSSPHNCQVPITEVRDQVRRIAEVTGVVVRMERRPQVGAAHQEFRTPPEQFAHEVNHVAHAHGQDLGHGVSVRVHRRLGLSPELKP